MLESPFIESPVMLMNHLFTMHTQWNIPSDIWIRCFLLILLPVFSGAPSPK